MNIFYFSTVWPQLNISAASVRVFGILDSLLKHGAKITFVSSSSTSKLRLSGLGQYERIKAIAINPNNVDDMTSLFQNPGSTPDVAIFDTFVSEEMFSPMVYQHFPNCLRVLDNQDFHSLRQKRQKQLQENQEINLDVISAFPTPYQDEHCARELASYYRSDLTLFCSDYEAMKASELFNLKNSGVITFFYPKSQVDSKPKFSFNRRKDFVWIGNFGHPPNLDAVKWIVKDIWPQISKALPGVELHLYGSNFSKEITEMESPTIKCKGLMKSLTALEKYRVMLSPLRFGAGIKGKITDSWANNLPVVTTPIGCESMFKETALDNSSKTPKEYYNYTKDSMKYIQELTFGGLCSNYENNKLSQDAISLYEDREIWDSCLQKGKEVLEKRMEFTHNEDLLIKYLQNYQKNLHQFRSQNHLQALVWSETLRSHEKLSKYLFEKNKNKIS